MQNFALLLLCFALGMALRTTGRLPEATPAALNGFIVHVSLPALTLHHLRHLQFDASVAAPLAMAWLLFATTLSAGIPHARDGAAPGLRLRGIFALRAAS